ncbi:MAG: hypothetical protein GX341_07775 [Firmicutes bacterium]|nr:hypothetical protein [Bacillota bacterium]
MRGLLGSKRQRAASVCVALGTAFLVAAFCPAVKAGTVLFSMEDRAGDDSGAGGLTYPLHEVFEPGLFDLRRVHVWHDDRSLYFDISFALVTNPWNAPEGFFHQLIDVYIDAEPGGYTQPAAEGPGVMFSPDAGWEYRLRIQPWAGSRWVDARSEPAQVYPVDVSVLPDGKTIRGEVPLSVTGLPSRSWRYYVLVGGFDTFGPDDYRAVEEISTQWAFGGAASAGGARVVDILDVGSGKRSQKAQLKADAGAGGLPVLLPVDGGLSLPFTWGHLLASIAVLTVLGSMFLLLPGQRPPGQAG